MGDRREFEMSEDQLEKLLDASKPVPAMFLSGGRPMLGTPQENANTAWQLLGQELGFRWDTVQPCPGKGQRFFMAVPNA